MTAAERAAELRQRWAAEQIAHPADPMDLDDEDEERRLLDDDDMSDDDKQAVYEDTTMSDPS